MHEEKPQMILPRGSLQSDWVQLTPIERTAVRLTVLFIFTLCTTLLLSELLGHAH